MTKMNRGRRKQNRKMLRGACKPNGSPGMGRKGAMPEPRILLAHVYGSQGTRRTSIPKLRELLHRGEWQKQNNVVVGDGISCERHVIL